MAETGLTRPSIGARFRLASRTLLGRLTERDAKEIVGPFDENAATVAYGMLSRIYGGASGEPPKRGTKEFLQAYSTSPMLRAATERIAMKMAATRWQLFARKRKGQRAERMVEWQTADYSTRLAIRKELQSKQELVEITEHPFLEGLARGNGLLTGYAVRSLTSIYLDTVGENFWLKERNGANAPSGFWPLPPHWVQETPTPSRPFFRLSFRGWQAEIPDTEILWWTVPDPENPYTRGSGVARAVADELDTDEFVAKYTSSFFHNRGVPNLLLFGEGLTEQISRQLERRWAAKYKTPGDLVKPFFTNAKIDVKEIGKSFRDLELVELRRYERDLVLQVYGVPPEVMGIVENSNRATIEAADFLMATYVLQPRLEAQREVLQQRLMPEYDDRLVLDFVSPIQEDKAFRLQAMTANPAMATVDEWRALQGLAPKEDGSGVVHLVSFSVLPTRRLDELPGALPTGEVDETEEEEEEEGRRGRG